MNAHAIGSAQDRALDASTKGRTGKARPGFHILFTTHRGVTANGTPSARQTLSRCTCAVNGNHAVVA